MYLLRPACCARAPLPPASLPRYRRCPPPPSSHASPAPSPLHKHTHGVHMNSSNRRSAAAGTSPPLRALYAGASQPRLKGFARR